MQQFQFPKKQVFSENSTLGAGRGLEDTALAQLSLLSNAMSRENMGEPVISPPILVRVWIDLLELCVSALQSWGCTVPF